MGPKILKEIELFHTLPERGGTGKLRSYWEKDINIVVECVKDLPIFKVKRENNKNSKIGTLHKNLLITCNELPTQP